MPFIYSAIARVSLSVLFQCGAAPRLNGTGISLSGWVLALLVMVLATDPANAGPCATDGGVVAGDPPMLERVAATVWRVPARRGQSDAVNAGQVAQLVLVLDGARLWLVGSGPTPAFGEALACAIRASLGREVSDVVNTRAQPELVLGNAAFARARIWALPDVARAMRAQCADCLARLKTRIGPAGASLAPDRIRLPTHPVGRPAATAGTLGPFRWLALPRAAGKRTLVLQLARERLVIAQGLVWSGALPDLRDTDSALLLASLGRLHRFAAGQRVIGEQGEIATSTEIARHVAYLRGLRAAIQHRIERGESEDHGHDAANERALESLAAGAPEVARQHALNRQRVWRELERRWFR
jgi:hypothetical protein